MPIPDAVLPPEPQEGTLYGPKEARAMARSNAILAAMLAGNWPEVDRLWQEVEKDHPTEIP